MKDNYLKKELYNLIKEDNRIFEFIQSGALDGIWYWDILEPENEWMSSKFWETLGYEPNEKQHLSSEWQDLINKEDLDLSLDNFKKHLEDPNHPYDQLVRYTHKDGSIVWIRCRGLAIRDSNGTPIRMLGAHTNVTELKKAEEKVAKITEEYEMVFNGTHDALFLVKVLGNEKFMYIRNNLSHQIRTGISLEMIKNQTPESLLGTELGRTVSLNYQRCVDQMDRISYEETLDLPGGERVWTTTLTPVFKDGGVDYIVGSAADITEQKRLEKQMEKQAYYDELTGLPNRRLFFDRLERVVSESERDNEIFALLFMDLDGFKSINDTYVHEVGDLVLKTTGSRLLSSVRKSDTVARMGGDEFTVILRDISDMKDAGLIVQKIYDKLCEEMVFGQNKCSVKASIGVALYPINDTEPNGLMKKADSSMYEIKKRGKGKGGIRFFQSCNGDGA